MPLVGSGALATPIGVLRGEEGLVMGLAIGTERRDDASVVRLEGDFDLHSCAGVRSEVEGLLDGEGATVYVDLAQVTFLDSTGLGTLVGLQKRANRGHARLVLCGLSPQIDKIVDVTHLRGAFTILPDVPEPAGDD